MNPWSSSNVRDIFCTRSGSKCTECLKEREGGGGEHAQKGPVQQGPCQSRPDRKQRCHREREARAARLPGGLHVGSSLTAAPPLHGTAISSHSLALLFPSVASDIALYRCSEKECYVRVAEQKGSCGLTQAAG